MTVLHADGETCCRIRYVRGQMERCSQRQVHPSARSNGCAVTAMMIGTVAVMHKNVHQRAGRQKQSRQPRQPRPDMHSVLGKQEKSANNSKGDEHELRTRAPSPLIEPSASCIPSTPFAWVFIATSPAVSCDLQSSRVFPGQLLGQPSDNREPLRFTRGGQYCGDERGNSRMDRFGLHIARKDLTR
jgi:hypothetical protein